MMKKIIELINKYKELILYVLFGGLTTVVNFVAFWICGKILGEELYLVSNAVAWIVSVVFAYVTNKLFVFESKSFAPKILAKEITTFVSARVFSFGVEEGGMWFFVDLLKFGEYSISILGFEISGQLISKLILAVVVVILNYFASKFVVFKNKNKHK